MTSRCIPRFALRAYNGGALNVRWNLPVVFSLVGLTIQERTPMLFRHDPGLLVGHATSLVRTDHRLAGIGVLDRYRVTNWAKRIATFATEQNADWPLSIGVAADDVFELAPGAWQLVNGRWLKGPLFIVTRGTLLEVSFVWSGADKGTFARLLADD